MSVVCWKCMRREVGVAGELCETCGASLDRKQRRWGAKSKRLTSTHPRTDQRYIVSYDDAGLDAVAYRDWMNRQ